MQENTVQSGAYVTKTDLTDAGPFVTGLMLTLPEPVFQGAVRPDTFSVFVRRCDRHTGEIIRLSKKAFSAEALKEAADGASQGWRSVSAAYPCDEQGRAVYASDKVMLEMPYGPLEPLSSRAARKNAMQNDFVDMQIRVTQIAPIPGAPACQGLVFDRCAGDLCPAFNGWQFSEAVTQKTPLRYAWYAPEQAAGEKRPLLIWLHGAGGGGADPRYPVAGNRVTAFSSQPAQKKLGSPWVYVPQCPTVWMDDGKGSPLMQSNNSVYIDCLKQAIDAFIAEHEASIDRSRIWVAGASNGGFMAVMQAMRFPGFYAAAVPVCEAVLTSAVTEAELEALAQTPMWFVHAKNDFVVPPELTVVPLYEALKARGAPVHFTFLERIRDESGRFCNADGTPFAYIPHFAWVPTYNDACSTDYDGRAVVVGGRAVTLQEWLGLQRRWAVK